MKLKLNNLKFLTYIFFLVIVIFFFYNTYYKPFPFFKVEYILSKSKFNQSPLKNLDFYEIQITEYKNILSENDNLIKFKDSDFFKKVQYATELTRKIQEKSLGKEIKIYENILSNDILFREICSESSKIFLYIMSLLGENARVIWLNGHTISEVWHNNNWIFVDTSSNTYAYDTNKKRFVSLLDIFESRSSIEFQAITKNNYKLWDYRYDPSKLHKIIDQNNLVFIISNKNIFNFHILKEKLNRVMKSMFFNSNFLAKQFIRDDKTPKVGNVGLNFYKRITN